jgi:phage-related protein
MRAWPGPGEKPLHWIASSKRDLLAFPPKAIRDIGFALGAVQHGGHPASAKPLKGFGAGVLEIAEEDRAGTFRVVYTVRFRKAAYVLHAFQKKSPSGIRTAQQDLVLIGERLKAAARDYEERYDTETD